MTMASMTRVCVQPSNQTLSAIRTASGMPRNTVVRITKLGIHTIFQSSCLATRYDRPKPMTRQAAIHTARSLAHAWDGRTVKSFEGQA